MVLFVFEYIVKVKYPGDTYRETAVIHAESKERARALLDVMLNGQQIDKLETKEYEGEYSETFW